MPVSMIKKKIAEKLSKFNCSEQEIKDVQYALIEASLRGIDTHGIRLFKHYVKQLEGGRSRANAELEIGRRTDSTMSINANGALGVVAGMNGVRKAVDMAKASGVAVVSVKNSNHFGAASVYALYAARHNMICLTFSNSDALIAPFNGKQAMLGTNPISMAAPSNKEDTFCLDMACSQVAFSKVREHLLLGKAVPESWMLNTVEQGGIGPLQPLGGYKGMGLSMMVQILTAVLSGSLLDHRLPHLYSEPYDKPHGVSQLFICLNIQNFIPIESFKSGMDSLLSEITNSQTKQDEQIFYPGKKEANCFRERENLGIPLSEEEYSALFSID